MLTSSMLMAVLVCGYLEIPKPDELQRRAVETRLAIHTLHMKLTIDQVWHDRYGQKGKGGRVIQVELWLDPSHYRIDIFTEGEPTPRDMAVGRRHVLCRNCERPGHAVQYFQGTTVALIRPDNRLATELFQSGEAFDPRLLGYTYSNIYSMPRPATSQTLGQDIISVERSPPTVESATLDGEAAWVLKSKWLRTGADNRIYLLPSKGWSVGRIESIGKAGSNTFQSKQQSFLEQDARTGIWYPTKFISESYENGNLRDRDTISLQVSEFNHQINPSVFTLAGMNIPDGADVLDPSLLAPGAKRQWMQFRGGKIVPYQKETPTESPPPEVITQPQPVDPSVVPGQFRWWYAAAAVLFGLAAFFLIRRAVKRAA